MKITKIILIFTFFLSNSCGYKPIYYKNDQLITKFNEIILEGEDRINRQIIDNLSLKIDFSRTLIFFSNSDESDFKYLVFSLFI